LAVFQPMSIGIFDQFISARMLDRYPQLYSQGQKNTFYDTKIFASWISVSVFQSLVMFFGFTYVYGEGGIMPDGNTLNSWGMGEIVYTIDLVSIAIKAILLADTWVRFTFMAIFGSLGLWFAVFPIYCYVAPHFGIGTELIGVIPPIYGSAVFWLSIIVIPVFANLRDYGWKYFKRMVWPTDYHIIQEMAKYNIQDIRPREDKFKKEIFKARVTQRIKRQRGFAFSQNEDGQAHLIRIYDTTR
jgi:phospholipid-transporting ATPase